MKTIVLFLMIFFLGGHLLAQNRVLSDFIVLYNNDTLFGKVEYIDERGAGRDFYKKIRLTDPEGKRTKYKRKNIAEFRVNGSQYKSFWLIQPEQSSLALRLLNPQYNIDPEIGKQEFLKLVSSGKLSWYELEWFDQGNSVLCSMSLLKKEDDSFLIRADQGILGLKKKVLTDYFFDCPMLQDRISQKHFTTVKEVVTFYNSGY